jgi:PKD repeat protein
MPRFKSHALTGIGVVITTVGLITTLVLGLDWLQVSASPLPQFPINSVRVISDPPPADLPGQFVERTLLQNHGGDPHPNWRSEDFDDSGWQPSYPVVTRPAWGLPVDATPPTDFIWGGPPGAGPFAGRYNIPNTGANQYLFIRKNFCIPINADLTSVSVVNPASFEIATTTVAPPPPPVLPPPGSATITFNGANVVTGLAGDESGTHYSLNLAVPVAAARQLGRNTLALRVRDDEVDNTAGVAYNLDFNYTIDPTALTLNSNPASPALINTAVTFSQNNNGLSNDGPFTFAWDFGDGTTSTAAAPTKVYNTPGIYVVRLTMTDRFGCPSAPVSLVYQVLGPPPSAADDDDDEAPIPTPPPSPTSTPSPSPTPAGPRYLPETGVLDQDQSAANSLAYLTAGTLLTASFSGLLFLLIGYGLTHHWFKKRD